jgi:hypothetical protein
MIDERRAELMQGGVTGVRGGGGGGGVSVIERMDEYGGKSVALC